MQSQCQVNIKVYFCWSASPASAFVTTKRVRKRAPCKICGLHQACSAPRHCLKNASILLIEPLGNFQWNIHENTTIFVRKTGTGIFICKMPPILPRVNVIPIDVLMIILHQDYTIAALSYFLSAILLTYWGRVTYICVSKLAIIGSDNGLSPGRRKAIIYTNAEIWLIRGTKLKKILNRNF